MERHRRRRGRLVKRGVSANGVMWTWRIERGFVLIDPTSTAAYTAGFGTGVSLGALILHELAHAVGLGHVDDPDQLMYPTLTRRPMPGTATVTRQA